MNRLKTWWRSRGRRWWSDYQFPIILAVGLIALILGFIGFMKNGIAAGEERTFFDNLYLTLGLLSMNTGAVTGLVSWELQVARFMVPLLTAYTAILALAMVFNQQVQQLRLWFIRDHVIICGLGRKGIRLAHQFLRLGEKVVVIESDENNEWIEATRTLGAIVLNADANDPEILRKARLNRAKYLLSVIGDDGTNAEVAVHAEKLSRQRDEASLTCVIHIVDPQLWYLLRENELYTAADSHFRLELFNIFDHGAGLLLKNYSPWGNGRAEVAASKRLVLVGLGKLGQSLVVQAASQWQQRRSASDERLRFTLIDLHAGQNKEALCTRYPNMEEVINFEPLEMDIRSAEFQRGGFLFDENGNCDVRTIYVCLDNDSFGLHTGLTLHKMIRDHNVPVIVRMAEDAGLALLLKEYKTATRYLKAFPLLDKTCTPDLILRGTHEILARDLHYAYLEGLDSAQIEAGGDLVLDAWADLPEETKERNRQQADRIAAILDKHGYRIAPLTDWKAADFAFDEGENTADVESMARMEHERWCQQMLDDGWKYGSERSQKQKTNPAIRSWEELSSEEIKKNMQFIRSLPNVLARAGFQIERSS